MLSTTAGTPAFFSPESVDRKVSTFEGRPVDVWAMGVTLFCMLFAETPFAGVNPTLLIAAINHTEADVRGQAEQLDVSLSEPVRMAGPCGKKECPCPCRCGRCWWRQTRLSAYCPTLRCV